MGALCHPSPVTCHRKNMIRFLTAGESHGPALVGIIEGIPSNLPLTAEDINIHLSRRMKGYGRGGRMKIEKDQIEILSGVRFSKTFGAPITFMIRNKDWENWGERMKIEGDGAGIGKISIPRPGHADLIGYLKYRFDDIRPVIDRSSARETATRVAMGSVSRHFLKACGIEIGSHIVALEKIGYPDLEAPSEILEHLVAQGGEALWKKADESEVRCLDKSLEVKMMARIDEAKEAGDTLGGIFEIIVTGLPEGLGSYVQYDRKLDAQLAAAIVSIPAVKGVEIGYGFANAQRPGSKVHDPIILKDGKFSRSTNRAGGTEGSMTTGMPLIIRGAMKPIPTLIDALPSVDLKTMEPIKARVERSDVCALPAASVVGESVVATVIANALLEKFGGDSLQEILERLPKR